MPHSARPLELCMVSSLLHISLLQNQYHMAKADLSYLCLPVLKCQDQNSLELERIYLIYISTSQSITKGS